MNIQTTIRANKIPRKRIVAFALALTCMTGIAASMPASAQAPGSSTAAAERQKAANKAAFYAGQKSKKAAELHQLQLNQAGEAKNAANKAAFYAGQRAKEARKAAFWANYTKTHPKHTAVTKK